MTPAADLAIARGTLMRARSRALDDPGDLLDNYAPGGFAWLDGDRGFVASGVAAVVAPGDAPNALAAVEHDAREGTPPGAGPRAVGALPFRGAGRLVVPERIVGRDAAGRAWCTEIEALDAGTAREPDGRRTAGRLATRTGVAAPTPPERRRTAGPLATRFRVAAATKPGEWRDMVGRVLRDIAGGRLEKVVLARAVEVDADEPFDVAGVLAYLRRTQPGCVVYSDRGLAGASPELLLRKEGARVMSRPLAGTGADAEALARSGKDAREHAYVVDAVVDVLRASCSSVRADGPRVLGLADVCHLATTVTARVDGAATSIADLLAALHPTPAVAGTPRSRALDAIATTERVGRGRYAGPCGWIDAKGDGEFVVALRGAEIAGAHAVLHAGAGIVAGSDPGAEWAETQQKLTPMLQALVRP